MTQGRTYGELWLENNRWHLRCDPHVAMYAKRVFQKIPTSASGVLTLPNDTGTCRDLEWFQLRFALDVKQPEKLAESAAAHRDHILRLDQIVDPNYKPKPSPLALPPRKYQAQAADLLLTQGYLLLGDEVGVGKTAAAIAAMADGRGLPALVVCLAHLPKQWEREINRFAPSLSVHILGKSKPYELPQKDGRGPDVIITSYHKLAGWADVLASYCRFVVFDEVQELRGGPGKPYSPIKKYAAAKQISDAAAYRLGLSATPIYNYGGEIFNVLEVLCPGNLGDQAEFYREWCSGRWDKMRFKDPDAFGSHLRECHIMLRRTRKDVGRELPDLTKITQRIDCDTKALDSVEGQAGELARIILAQHETAKGQKMQAAAEFDAVLRQATGIAKAPHVAAFVRMLLESGEPVVLYGWHRSVYKIWQEKLAEFDPALYTGTESPAEKDREARRFITGETPLIILSLRSGAGLDGLQQRCRTVVLGELDWSHAVHHQNIGRVYRDGQTDPVVAYFLLSEGGLDPFMAQTLGIKRQQLEGLQGDGNRGVLERVDNGEMIRKLAETYLAKSQRQKRRAG